MKFIASLNLTPPTRPKCCYVRLRCGYGLFLGLLFSRLALFDWGVKHGMDTNVRGSPLVLITLAQRPCPRGFIPSCTAEEWESVLEVLRVKVLIGFAPLCQGIQDLSELLDSSRTNCHCVDVQLIFNFLVPQPSSIVLLFGRMMCSRLATNILGGGILVRQQTCLH